MAEEEGGGTLRSRLLGGVAWWLLLVTGASFGACTRYFINRLADVEADATVSGDIFGSKHALILGCFIYGLILPNKKHIHPVLYFGIGTAFCGSLTTFSTWMYEAVVLLLNGPVADNHHLPHNLGDQVLSWLGVIVTGTAASVGAFFCGYVVGKGNRKNPIAYTPTWEDERALWAMIGVSLLLLGGLCGVIAHLATDFDYHELVWLATFATPGALLRHLLCTRVKRRIYQYFVWNGTLAANVLGSLIFGILVVVREHNKFNDTSSIVSNGSILAGFIGGFCSSLTTVSTFVPDAFHLARDHSDKPATVFVLWNIVLVQFFFFLTVGVYVWSTAAESQGTLAP